MGEVSVIPPTGFQTPSITFPSTSNSCLVVSTPVDSSTNTSLLSTSSTPTSVVAPTIINNAVTAISRVQNITVTTKKNIRNKNTRPNVDFSRFTKNWCYSDSENELYTPNIFPFSATPGLIDPLLFSSDNIELDFFTHFVDESLVNHIVEETNRYSEQVKKEMTKNGKELSSRSPMKLWKKATVGEMYKFLAINFLMALVKKNNLHEYWTTREIDETPIFARIMPRSRFLLLMQMFHLNNNDLQTDNDRMHKFFPLYVTLLRRYQATFYPYKKLCIDESIVQWKGRLSFKQYIPSKRHRFGIKLFVLCCSKTGYILNFEVYTGHRDETVQLPVSMKTVMNLLQPYLNVGHQVFVDNYYTSPQLFAALYEKQTNACGTVRTNRRGMPKFPKLKTGEHSVRTLDQNFCKMLAIKWHDKRAVHMLSTIHDGSFAAVGKKDRCTGELKQKPSCVIDYNINMGLIDKSDMQISFNDASRKTLKWYKKLVFHFLDLTMYNAYIICKMVKGDPKLQFSEFKRKIVIQIINKYGLHRKRKTKRPSEVDDAKRIRLEERHFPILNSNLDKKGKPKQRKCVVHWKTTKNPPIRKETIYECQECGSVPLCVVPCFKLYHSEENF